MYIYVLYIHTYIHEYIDTYIDSMSFDPSAEGPVNDGWDSSRKIAKFLIFRTLVLSGNLIWLSALIF
jgi:hypothetical protein